MAKRNTITKTGIICAATLLALSCTTAPHDGQVVGDIQAFFSLEDYFKQEATRLQELAPTISKTVAKDGAAESHDIQINDWEDELALFIDSDINKDSWRSSYKVDSTATSLAYTSLDPNLRTQRITVQKHRDGTVKHIEINNQVDNMLYRSREQLDYYPDSLYRITKSQRVRVIGESQYVITGNMP